MRTSQNSGKLQERILVTIRTSAKTETADMGLNMYHQNVTVYANIIFKR